MIELKNVSKSYTSLSGNTIILSNVSLNLPDTGFVALCGRSGCGKTTLFNMISGFDDKFSGEILYDGVNVNKLKHLKRSKFFTNNVFYLRSRDNFIKNLTVKKTIYVYLEKQTRLKALELIKEFDLESLLNKKIKNLSSGELQKVSIIIAVCKNARFTLLDEPICNIDEASVEKFLGLIKELSLNSLVMYISHYEDDFDKYFSHILLLEDGKFIEKKTSSTYPLTNKYECSNKYNFRRSLIIERSKPQVLYSLFRVISILIITFLIYVTKINKVTVSSIYLDSIDKMSVNVVNARRNGFSSVLQKKRIYSSPMNNSRDVYLNSFEYWEKITGFGCASDFKFSGFNGKLVKNEIIISDYLSYQLNKTVGDTVSIHQYSYDGETFNDLTKYVIKHIYSTNYASYLSNSHYSMPEEYSYVYISDSELEEIINDSLYSFGGVTLNNNSFYTSGFDHKFVDCKYYDRSGLNDNYAELEYDEFLAGQLALTKLGLGSISSDFNSFYYGTGDSYYDITFSYNGKTVTKKMRYRTFANNYSLVVVSKELYKELIDTFGINEDNVLNYKEVTTLDISNPEINSFFDDFVSFDNLTFVNDNILTETSARIESLKMFYNQNLGFIILILGIFLSLSLYKIVMIEYEYYKLLNNKNFNTITRLELFLSLSLYKIVMIEYEYYKLLKNKNFNTITRLELFLTSKLIVYLIISIILIIISNLIIVF